MFPASTSRSSLPRAGQATWRQVVAKSDRIRTLLGWQPKFDDLETIVRHALVWERQRRMPLPRAPLASVPI
jgi:UDP-glucose 4-epimerase